MILSVARLRKVVAVSLGYVWVQTTAIVAAIERQVVAIGGGHVPTDIQLNSVFEPDITWLQEPGALHD